MENTDQIPMDNMEEQELEGEVIDIAEGAADGKTELEEVKAQAAFYLDKLQRMAAEFENFRNRTTKDLANIYDNGIKDAISRLLPIIDNFDRSLIGADSGDNFVKGVMMIQSQLTNMLEDLGITKIPAIGQTFDPKLHSAISHIEDEQYGKNEIAQEMQAGYMYKDGIIRHSMVVVAN